MSGTSRKNCAAAQDNDGLALALLLGEAYLEMIGFLEDIYVPAGKSEVRRPCPVPKPAWLAAGKRLRLRRV